MPNDKAVLSDDGDMSDAQDESEDENGLERRLSGPHPRVTKILLELPGGRRLGVPAGIYVRPPANEPNDVIHGDDVHDGEEHDGEEQHTGGVVSSKLFDGLVERVTVHPSSAAGGKQATTRRRRRGGGKKK